MPRRRFVAIAVGTVLVAAAVVVASLPRNSATAGQDLIPNTPEVAEVQRFLADANVIITEATYTLDPSDFDRVFVNDPRGGSLSDAAVKKVREFWTATGNSLAARADYTPGYLDYRRAVNAELLDNERKMQARAASPTSGPQDRSAGTSGPTLRPTPLPVLMTRRQGPIRITPLSIKSIEVAGEVATVVVSGEGSRGRWTLVRTPSGWRIAGTKTLAVYP